MDHSVGKQENQISGSLLIWKNTAEYLILPLNPTQIFIFEINPVFIIIS